jgi:quercetin dioxygenase-like cupin family protein
MTKRKAILVAAIGFGAAAIFGVTALATPGGGFMGSLQIRGTLPNHVQVNADRIKFSTKGETDVVVQTITYSPGGFSGWHTHPGFVLAVVESGALTIQVGCSAHTYGVTKSFYESGTTPIMARNDTKQDTVVRVTYVVPKGAAVRRDVPESQIPDCSEDRSEG